ncbi:MAG: CocE/NonD family hydrolase [Chloroflexi bacterium]|nr:CocE/NonD family hydrolase [Chloroflexota bacterium]
MPYSGSPQLYTSTVERGVMLPMRDGVRLATDVYRPALDGQAVAGQFPVILERTPYDKGRADLVANGQYFARRGYVCVIQDVRGRFNSEGEWYAFAKEAPDGYDTVEWLARQPWSGGQIGTVGASYAGSDQSALATLNPPHLKAMVVAVGASNYFHASMRQNGALEYRFQIYAFRMATTSKEALADPALKAALDDAFDHIGEWVGRAPLKEGASPLRLLPSYERWALDILTRGDYDDYWKQRGYAINEYYAEHADVPTLYLGGWYDSYARATCENYVALSRMKKSPQRLLMGPWTHGGWGNTYAGDVDFGAHSMLDDYNDLRCAWFDWTLKGMSTVFTHAKPVRIFVMGGGDGRRHYSGRLNHGGRWRDEDAWPPPGARDTPYYLRADGLLTPQPPAEPTPDPVGGQPSRYTFNPRDPVPTIGGGISAAEPIMRNGAFDQRARPDFFGCKDSLPLRARSDVLVFETEPLTNAVEVTGPIMVNLWASTSAKDSDFTAKLIDVYPPSADYPDGFAMNLTDSIIRARYRGGYTRPELLTPHEIYPFTFALYPTSNLFQAGHRIRLDISSSNFPRFDVNPNTGGPLGAERRVEVAQQAVYHDAAHPSHVVLPVIER